MPNFRSLSTLSCVLALLGGSAAFGQSGAAAFKAGEWQVNSTVTVDGRSVSSQQSVCAEDASDFWKQKNAAMQCQPPDITSVPSGVHVQLACNGSSGPVAWKMQSSVTEIFSNGGNSFTATGSTTTTTSYPGGSPMTASGVMRSEGTYRGACAAK